MVSERTLDGRPDPNVNIIWKAGDTLTISIAPANPGDDLGVGLQWDAQVRATAEATAPAATFDITPPAVVGDAAVLVLSADQTRALAETAGAVAKIRDRRGLTRQVIRFDGVWDCQTSDAGADPVRTIAAGNLTIDLDVTRETGP